MVTSATARPRSARIIVERLPRLSTHAPACSPNSRLGSHCSAVRYPIATAPACSTRTAVSGTAIDDTWSPNTETVDAPQYRRNTLSRSNGGTRSRRPAPAFIAIKAYGRNRDNARVTGHLGAPGWLVNALFGDWLGCLVDSRQPLGASAGRDWCGWYGGRARPGGRPVLRRDQCLASR